MCRKDHTPGDGCIRTLATCSPGGWMDYIAQCIFEAVMKRRGPSLELGDSLAPTRIPLHEEAADRFFNARRALANGDRTAPARREGVAAAARKLHDLLRRLPATHQRERR